MDKKTFSLFIMVMMILCGVMLYWRMVDLWPRDWLVWRAELGDQQAVAGLLKRAHRDNDTNQVIMWSKRLAPVTDRDALFMERSERRIMHRLLTAQGVATPLLDAIENGAP